MNYLFVIPARGGSKGIPKKNICLLCGKPLLAYSIEAVLAAGLDGDLAVSSDSDEILDVAERYEGITAIKRPEEISGDRASTESALLHAVGYMREWFGREYDAVVTVQPTSPLRTADTIRKFLKNFEENTAEYDAQLTLSEDRSDFWVRTDAGMFRRLYPDAPRRRQDRNPLYTENSCLYVTKTGSLSETSSVLGHRVNGFVIPPEEGVDINELKDLILAESYLNSRCAVGYNCDRKIKPHDSDGLKK